MKAPSVRVAYGLPLSDLKRILAVLAQVADMERQRIKERCDTGRVAARAALAATGKTHKGKASLGRPFANDAETVKEWKVENSASIAQTAKHFSLSVSTIKRYCGANQPERHTPPSP